MLREETKRLIWLTFPTRKDLVMSWRKVYLQCADKIYLPTHVRRPFTTYTVDLRLEETELLANYSKKLRENIRRAVRDDIRIERDEDPTAVVDLFQTTIQEQHLNPLRVSDFATKNNILITRALHPQLGILAAHAYQLDSDSRRVKLLYNASAFRLYPTDKAAQYLCGRANSYLFHHDFLYFQEHELAVFDFGGYGLGTPQVDYFKRRFGGLVVHQYNYYPIWYYLVRMIRNRWKNRPHAQ